MEKRINIEAERARYQLTKEQLCHKLGITGKTYLSYIRGGSMPLEKAVQLARMFGCSLDYIAGLTETRQPLNPQQPPTNQTS